jgi:hypothetical protein
LKLKEQKASASKKTKSQTAECDWHSQGMLNILLITKNIA